MHIAFPNICESGWAFTIHSNSCDLDCRHEGFLAFWAGTFPTFGDGLTQHGHEYTLGADHFGAYCASLTHFILESGEPQAVEAGKLLVSAWHQAPAQKVQFALRVKHRPDRRQWYSLGEEKVSTSESRRHDRRWEEVPEWADGSLAAVWRLLRPDWDLGLLNLYGMAEEIRDEFYRQTQSYPCTAAELIGLKWNRGEALLNRQAFQAMRHACSAFGLLDQARGTLGCWKSNSGWKQKQEQKAVAATA
jgi:hypothetical protein